MPKIPIKKKSVKKKVVKKSVKKKGVTRKKAKPVNDQTLVERLADLADEQAIRAMIIVNEAQKYRSTWALNGLTAFDIPWDKATPELAEQADRYNLRRSSELLEKHNPPKQKEEGEKDPTILGAKELGLAPTKGKAIKEEEEVSVPIKKKSSPKVKPGKDRFGSRLGSQVAVIHEQIVKQPRSIEQIAKLSGAPTSRVKRRLGKMVEANMITKVKNGYKLND